MLNLSMLAEEDVYKRQIQGPGQACNLRDNGFNVIVGQRQGKTYEKCLKEMCIRDRFNRVATFNDNNAAE